MSWRSIRLNATGGMSSKIINGIALVVAQLCAASGGIAAHEFSVDDIVTECRRQELVLESLYVRYRVQVGLSGDPNDAKKFLCANVPASSAVLDAIASLYEERVLAFKGNLRYTKTAYSNLEEVLGRLDSADREQVPRNRPTICSFNGKKTYIVDSQPKNEKRPIAVVSSPEKKAEEGGGADIHYDHAYLDSCLRPLPNPFDGEIESEALSLAHVLKDASAVLAVDLDDCDGSPCVVVEWNVKCPWYQCDGSSVNELMRHKIWCDPALRFAIRRHEVRFEQHGRILAESTSLSDFVEAADGVWFPKLCEHSRYAPPHAPVALHDTELFHCKLTVDEIHANDVEDGLFTPVISVGMTVTDYTHEPRPLSYVMPATDVELRKIIDDLLVGKDYKPKTRPLLRYYAISSFILGAILVCVGVMHRRANGHG